MAIVKIFPKDTNKSDFSIRFFATKFHLFEGDKIIRSNLKSEAEAESEMNKIALSDTYSSIRYVIQRFSTLQIPFKS